MAKKGTMPTGSTLSPVAGVKHYPTKQATAPAQRQNLTTIRVSPMKRMQANIKGPKPDKPSNVGNF